MLWVQSPMQESDLYILHKMFIVKINFRLVCSLRPISISPICTVLCCRVGLPLNLVIRGLLVVFVPRLTLRLDPRSLLRGNGRTRPRPLAPRGPIAPSLGHAHPG